MRRKRRPRRAVAAPAAKLWRRRTIQGSCLENAPNSDEASLDWFDISDISLTSSSVLTHKTFKVNANWIRIKHVPTAGSISKVLIRN